MVIVVLVAAYWLARFLAPRVRTWLAAWPAAWTSRDTSFTRLDLATRAPFVRVEAEPDPLCSRCVYAHIVRGAKAEEEMIECGYAFPARVLPFRVRECTDYRPKRERNRVDEVNGSAVCILPLEETAAEVHAVTAARNGEGES